MAHRYTAKEAARARRQRGGHASCRAQIALGMIPGAAARIARRQNAARRREEGVKGLVIPKEEPKPDIHGRTSAAESEWE